MRDQLLTEYAVFSANRLQTENFNKNHTKFMHQFDPILLTKKGEREKE